MSTGQMGLKRKSTCLECHPLAGQDIPDVHNVRRTMANVVIKKDLDGVLVSGI